MFDILNPLTTPWHWLYFHIRYFGVAFGALAVAGMTFSAVIRRQDSVRRTRRVFFWFYLLIANGTYGVGYNLTHDFPPTPPALITTFLFLGTALAIFWHPEGDYSVPAEGDNSMPERFLSWLDDHVRRIKNRHRE